MPMTLPDNSSFRKRKITRVPNPSMLKAKQRKPKLISNNLNRMIVEFLKKESEKTLVLMNMKRTKAIVNIAKLNPQI